VNHDRRSENLPSDKNPKSRLKPRCLSDDEYGTPLALREFPMSQTAPATVGQKIDALIEPFVRDETKLEERAAALAAQVEALTREIAEVQSDLGVVRAAKIDALRQAATDDSLLRAVFGLTSGEAQDATLGAAELHLVDTDAAPGPDGHPLLSPAG
jgi:hypothetical protein